VPLGCQSIHLHQARHHCGPECVALACRHTAAMKVGRKGGSRDECTPAAHSKSAMLALALADGVACTSMWAGRRVWRAAKGEGGEQAHPAGREAPQLQAASLRLTRQPQRQTQPGRVGRPGTAGNGRSRLPAGAIAGLRLCMHAARADGRDSRHSAHSAEGNTYTHSLHY
jgi:hypothetical protein